MRPIKGLRRDERAVNQPADTWRRAKNMLARKGFLTNEPGFVLDIVTVNGVAQTRLNKEIIGIINTGKDYVIFSCDSGGAGLGSEIGVCTTGIYKTVVADDLFNFSKSRPIEGVFKYNFNGQLVVVWWEGVTSSANPIRLLNLNRLPFALTGFALTNPADISLAELFPPAKLPIVSTIAADDGGTLTTGAYFPIFNYEYPDGNDIGWTPPYNPVHIYDDSNSNTYNNTDGAVAGSASPKRIRIDLTNVDTSFFNIQVGYIKVEGGVVTAGRVKSIRITGAAMTVSIDGNEIVDDIPLEDVIVPRVTYPFAKTGTTLEDRLYLGNVRSRAGYDFQKYANNIKVKWTVGDHIGVGTFGSNDSVNNGTYKEQKFTFFDRSFQADETYALYLAYVNNDMTYSEAYHIPGRAPLSDGKEYDLAGVASVPSTNAEELLIAAGAKKFQFDNTADDTGRMGFWENDNERYVPVDLTAVPPNIDSQVWNSGGAVIDDLSNKKVRHHKFPSLEALERWGYRLNKNAKLTTPFAAAQPSEQLRFRADSYRGDGIALDSDKLNLENVFGGTKDPALVDLMPSFLADQSYFIKVDNSVGSQKWRFQMSEAPPARSFNNGLENCNRSLNNFAEKIVNGVPVNNTRVKFGYDQTIKWDWTLRFQFGVKDGGGTFYDSTLTYAWEHRRKDGTLVNFQAPVSVLNNIGGTLDWNGGSVGLNNYQVLKDDYFEFIVELSSTTAPVGSGNPSYPRFFSGGGAYEATGLLIETLSVTPYAIVESVSRSFVQPLGIELSDIYIPQEIADNVQGFVIMYAKRGSNNLTILGQSGLINNKWEDIQNNTNVTRWTDVRTYDFLMLKNKIPNVPAYFKTELVIATEAYRDNTPTTIRTNFRNGVGYDIDRLVNIEGEVMSFNYANITHHPSHIIRKINDFAYVPENVIISTPVALDNLGREEFGLVRFSPGFLYPPIDNIYQNTADQRMYGSTTYYFGNLKAYRAEVYASYNNQQLVTTGKMIPVNGTGIYSSGQIFGGDVFKTPVGFRLNHTPPGDDEIIYNVVESPGHIALRHAVNPSEYYPHSQFTGASVTTSYYDYNDDYSRINDLFVLTIHDARFPKPTAFPTRIPRSIVSRNEEYKISWNKFLASDYYEMPKDKGVIWKLDVRNRELMINHEFAFYVATNKDQLTTDGQKVYTGTGDIFDRLPDEKFPIKGGYAGCQSQWAAFNCKNGYFFVDKKQGKFFLYTGAELKEISTEGLEIELYQRLRDSNTQDNPFTGAGLTGGYDVKNNRLLVCKAGFKFNEATKLYDPDNFTLSYSFDINAWISNHDYTPSHIFNNREALLSVKNTVPNKGEIYHHNIDGIPGKFYDGVIYKSYVDIPFNKQIGDQKVLDSVEWISEVVNILTGATYRDLSFTHLMVYNNNQCSAIIDLRDTPTWFTKPSRNNEGIWSANYDFRDVLLTPETPILDKDGEVFSNVLNTAPAWFNKNLFLETFGIVRFIYYNADGKTIYLHEADAKYSKSAR